MSVDLEALEKSLTFRALDEGECEGLIAEVRALRAERDRLLHALDGQAEIEAGFESARGLLAQRDALRAERDKWMADHARQYSIAAAYAVERDALRAERDRFGERLAEERLRSAVLERLLCEMVEEAPNFFAGIDRADAVLERARKALAR